MTPVAERRPERIVETAPAKINLALHVTGRRDDGYHLLDSLVTFAEDGDELVFETADSDSFRVVGRFGTELSQDDNLVLQARDLLRAALDAQGQPYRQVAITLDKSLPIASGIGGGSADAAAALRGLSRLWKADLPAQTLLEIAIQLGADVPMCLASTPLRARGIGEAIEKAAMPSVPLVLLNPLKPVSTPEIFRSLTRRDNAPIGEMTAAPNVSEWMKSLSVLRNDLQPRAEALVPEIAEACDLLRQSLAGFVRMSGSGATCFGLYETEAAAMKAALALSAYRPNWYVLLTRTVPGEI
ncbi:4-diphosphocytidyl-2-C-methyl-D-erythritol kinase [Rhizobium rosettiformans]|uniref:4-diphosphocytidyl-2-C-methyl-D-erythritol kinase n=2 Tax=Rhizobium rosettiformans TaxID=1368430 RepID=A0A4S8PUG4_9HYPH|nr:4-(cytidine 5'-diphospho)-2-C-methyl-D-erythritol kinase [Rhizobium rosettiformans]MBB5274639.1 4-diphosphocytidyl-2-C-methyl-D-erythritol kinase [Rhizobium rosettiformans]THV34031.1 4-(cytidine 5'-diphospho)-2-C-methyl-D-erythritol kinase [Rhizobium rosettiformans W3]